MDSKEAIELMRTNYRTFLETEWDGKDDNPYKLAFEKAMGALERETADGCKVKRVPVHEGCYLCPNCGNQVSNIKDKFCNQCGTKLIFDYGEPIF